MTLQALRHRIGDDDFWTAAAHLGRRPRRRQRHRSEEFEALAEQVSGEDLDGFFDAWLDTRASRRPPPTTACG